MEYSLFINEWICSLHVTRAYKPLRLVLLPNPVLLIVNITANSHLPSKADSRSAHSHTVQRLINASLCVSRMVFSEISKASALSSLQFRLNKAHVINPSYILITWTVIGVGFKRQKATTQTKQFTNPQGCFFFRISFQKQTSPSNALVIFIYLVKWSWSSFSKWWCLLQIGCYHFRTRLTLIHKWLIIRLLIRLDT